MRRLEELLQARERIAAGYEERLAGIVRHAVRGRGRPPRLAGVRRSRIDRRDEAMAALRDAGIQCQIGTYALHRLSAYRDQGDFPGADAAFERALALPLHTRLTESELDRVAETLAPFA